MGTLKNGFGMRTLFLLLYGLSGCCNYEGSKARMYKDCKAAAKARSKAHALESAP
jgi:hypothetical protein